VSIVNPVNRPSVRSETNYDQMVRQVDQDINQIGREVLAARYQLRMAEKRMKELKKLRSHAIKVLLK
jgi:hypothetical protein